MLESEKRDHTRSNERCRPRIWTALFIRAEICRYVYSAFSAGSGCKYSETGVYTQYALICCFFAGFDILVFHTYMYRVCLEKGHPRALQMDAVCLERGERTRPAGGDEELQSSRDKGAGLVVRVVDCFRSFFVGVVGFLSGCFGNKLFSIRDSADILKRGTFNVGLYLGGDAQH